MIRMDGRLRCAFDMLRGAEHVADIGCDHGKLTIALLQEGGCKRVIAGDISSDCLEKTRRIVSRYGFQSKAEVRLGDGLSILAPGECDGAAILGMGGELIAHMLQSSPAVAESLERLVLQPMSGIEELRQWLFKNGYHVREDRLVADGSRWYQLFCVQKGRFPDPWPEGFPAECFLVGYRSFMDGDRLLGQYCEMLRHKRVVQLRQAAGTTGEAKLSREVCQLSKIIEEVEKWK